MTHNISPDNIWKDRETKSATKLQLREVNDDLFSQAVFYYELRTTTNEIVTAGNITMSGTTYTNWNTSANATPAAFDWAAGSLNLTLSA